MRSDEAAAPNLYETTAKHLSISSANCYANKLNHSKTWEVLVQKTQAESANVPFWPSLAPSVPFVITSGTKLNISLICCQVGLRSGLTGSRYNAFNMVSSH